MSPREYFETRAASYADSASLNVEKLAPNVDMLGLEPHNEDSLPVYLIDSGNGDFQIGLTFNQFDVRNENVLTTADVDAFLAPVLEGRARFLIGRDRAVVQVRAQGKYENLGFNGRGLGSLLPRPGWKGRARVVNFSPYRAAAD